MAYPKPGARLTVTDDLERFHDSVGIGISSLVPVARSSGMREPGRHDRSRHTGVKHFGRHVVP